jgi:hypothetical protein
MVKILTMALKKILVGKQASIIISNQNILKEIVVNFYFLNRNYYFSVRKSIEAKLNSSLNPPKILLDYPTCWDSL